MEKGLILVAWLVLTLIAVRPVPGRGIPLGRRLTRIYLNRRQAVMVGGGIAAFGLLLLGFALLQRQQDFALVGVALLWLGGLYLFHGLKQRGDAREQS